MVELDSKDANLKFKICKFISIYKLLKAKPITL